MSNTVSQLLQILNTTPLLADGAMGSYLFTHTGRLSEMNHVYETFNADRPDLIQQVHAAYLQAGARCLTTNTFTASRIHLAPFKQEHRVEELNRAGVAVARKAISAHCEQARSDDGYFVLGSVGPTLQARESPEEVKDIYREQVDALLAAGVDALMLETFTSLSHVQALIELAQAYGNPPPLIVHMVLHHDRDRGWDQDPRRFVQTVFDLGVRLAGVNCCAPWEATAFLDAVEKMEVVEKNQLMLSLMPNGGELRRIGHRYLTGVNSEFMGKFARDVALRGVRLIGGCCQVHPAHISEMHNYLHSYQAGRQISFQVEDSPAFLQPVDDEEKKKNGPFSRKIKEGEFAVSVEMLPTRGTGGLKARMGFVATLASSGLADAVDITDGSRGIPLMPPGDFIGVIRERLGWGRKDRLELIPHFTTRDLNVMGLQSRLIGYWARHIHNVLFVTGDPPKMSPTYPRSTAVFDLDSVAMIRYAHRFLNRGMDFGGQPLGAHQNPRTRFTIGTGFEPEAVDLDHELEKLRRKIDGRADYIMTQPAFRFQPLDVLEPFRDQIAILVGVLILTSLEQARRVGQVPGVIIPESIYKRLAKYAEVEDQAKVGQEIASEQVRGVREKGWAGLYLMSPATHAPVLEVLRMGSS